MITVERATRVAIPAAVLFDLFLVPKKQRLLCQGYVDDISGGGIEIGSVRTYHAGGHIGAGQVRERLDKCDPERMELEFLMVDTGDLVPFADYRGLVRITHAGPNACIAMLRSTFVPVDVDAETARQISERNYDLVFANLKRLRCIGGEVTLS